MSSKISQPTGGRRTPLSLGPAGQKTNQKSITDPNPPDSTTIDLKNLKSDDKTPILERTDSPAKNLSAKDTTNNVTENKKEKTSKKDSVSVNSHENGHGHVDKEENLKKVEKKLSRESTRNKDVLKTDAKEINKETEKTKPEKEKDKRATPVEKKENLKKSNEDVQKDNKINESDDETKKTEVTKKKMDKHELKKAPVEEVVPLKRASRASTKQSVKQEQNITGDTLSLQQELQDFDDNDVEMESLLLDLDVPKSATTIPTAAKTTSTHSPSIRSRIPIKSTNEEKRLTPTPRRSLRKEVEAPVITHTEVEPPVITHKFTPPSKLPAVDVPFTSTPDGKTYYSLHSSSLRQISGRRSLRPLKEYTFQYNNTNYRESYRRVNTELDCTNNTSMNVTVGSEAPQSESFLSSFFSFGRGKKRTLTPPPTVSTTDEIQDDAVNTNTASPKRPRLDLSGLIGLVTSPVTMLKNHLYRGSIDSSTPNNKTEDINDAEIDADGDDDGVDNVSEIISEEKKILLEEEEKSNKNNTDDTTAELDDEDEDEDGEEEEDESNDSIEKEKSIEHLSKIEIGDEAIAGSNENNDEVVVKRRGLCDIM